MSEGIVEGVRAAWPNLDVQAPPSPWEPSVDRNVVLVLLDALVDCAAGSGEAGAEVRLLLSNVTVEPEDERGRGADAATEDAATEDHGLIASPGDYVALSVISGRRWVDELTWRDRDVAILIDREVDDRARAASVVYAYARVLDDVSLTCFIPRAPG